MKKTLSVTMIAIMLLFVACNKEAKNEVLSEEQMSEQLANDPVFVKVYEKTQEMKDYIVSNKSNFNKAFDRNQIQHMLLGVTSSDEVQKNLKAITNSDDFYSRFKDFNSLSSEFNKKYMFKLMQYKNKSAIVESAYLKLSTPKMDNTFLELFDDPCRANCKTVLHKAEDRCDRNYAATVAACGLLSGGILTGIGCVFFAGLQAGWCNDDAYDDYQTCLSNCPGGGGLPVN